MHGTASNATHGLANHLSVQHSTTKSAPANDAHARWESSAGCNMASTYLFVLVRMTTVISLKVMIHPYSGMKDDFAEVSRCQIRMDVFLTTPLMNQSFIPSMEC